MVYEISCVSELGLWRSFLRSQPKVKSSVTSLANIVSFYRKRIVSKSADARVLSEEHGSPPHDSKPRESPPLLGDQQRRRSSHVAGVEPNQKRRCHQIAL